MHFGGTHRSARRGNGFADADAFAPMGFERGASAQGVRDGRRPGRRVAGLFRVGTDSGQAFYLSRGEVLAGRSAGFARSGIASAVQRRADATRVAVDRIDRASEARSGLD